MRLPRDFWDDWQTEADDKVGIVQLLAAFLTFVFLIGVILFGAVIVAAWTNALP